MKLKNIVTTYIYIYIFSIFVFAGSVEIPLARAKVYLDDIVIWAKTMDEMIENLRLVLQSLREANLKLKPSKCKLFRESVDMLGHVISANGISTDPAKTKIVQNWREPRNIGELRTFIGMTSYYRKFIRNYSEKAKPLTTLTLKNASFNFGETERKAFECLKNELSTSPVLAFPTGDGTICARHRCFEFCNRRRA